MSSLGHSNGWGHPFITTDNKSLCCQRHAQVQHLECSNINKGNKQVSGL